MSNKVSDAQRDAADSLRRVAQDKHAAGTSGATGDDLNRRNL